MGRFTLRTLLLAVAFVGLAIVATMNANRSWVVAMEAMVYLLLSTAIVGALWTIGERRAFWGGCAVFGWTLWLAGALQVQLPGAGWGDLAAGGLYQLYQADEIVDDQERRRRWSEADVAFVSVNQDINQPRMYRVHYSAYSSRLNEVTRMLLVIVAGVIGGVVGAWFWRVGRKE